MLAAILKVHWRMRILYIFCKLYDVQENAAATCTKSVSSVSERKGFNPEF